ncbi:MAG: hypothetical protein RL701_4180 [Pseudomonadota bacterium]|jgi:uncharacterized protein with FMN-binding domain
MKMALIGVVCVVVIVAVIVYSLMSGANDIRRLVIQSVDLEKVPDGRFHGSYHKGRWTYDVEVVVADHRIVSVKNINPRMKAARAFNDAAEAKMIELQRVDVDVVSGATLNSRAFERAVELALSGSHEVNSLPRSEP